MILLDGPYISNFLLETIKKNRFSVIQNNFAETFGNELAPFFVDAATVLKTMQQTENARLYTASENSIGWIAKHLHSTDLPAIIELFKNKAKFRDLVAHLYPEFYFQQVDLATLLSMSGKDVPLPCVVKPTTGFFSLGVFLIASQQDFAVMQAKLQADIDKISRLYPTEVLDTQSFIIEEYIVGEEFAIDAYFDATGEPIILGILKHIFSSDQDVSDRVYMTSAEIIAENLPAFTEFLQQVGKLTNAKNFPVHVELRRRKDSVLLPIEINPMRFGGWCTTADLAHHAWNFNPYEYYLLDKKPDWPKLTAGKEDVLYSLIVLDNSTGVDGAAIQFFDYAAVVKKFAKPLELRKIDFQQFPLFGFIFVETAVRDFSELTNILHDDLRDFIQ